MNPRKYFLHGVMIAVSVLLVSCETTSTSGTLGSLDAVDFKVKDEKINDSLDKAMESYQQFLSKTPETAMTPEAIRRLADLKIQKDYTIDNSQQSNKTVVGRAISKVKESNDKTTGKPDGSKKTVADSAVQKTRIDAPKMDFIAAKEINRTQRNTSIAGRRHDGSSPIADLNGETEKAFEKRAGEKIKLHRKTQGKLHGIAVQNAEDARAAGAEQAIELYRGLLKKYPLFKRNDEVLYQLSRAYEENGMVEKAMQTLQRLIKRYPNSRHIDEAQFRRAEYFFTRKKYLDAEDAYQAVIKTGIRSEFYELALYKQGWTFFKQELYEEALTDYIRMLDYKIKNGYDLENIKNKIEKKRVDDTYRVISLSFSYLGGASAIGDYFSSHGHRDYEASIYSHLGEYYLSKRRFSDAAGSYNAYIKLNPLSKESPYFGIRVIEIYKKGGFPKLVVDAKKAFSVTYGLHANYWAYFKITKNPQILAFLKSNLIDLANHYHALYQQKRFRNHRAENYHEAIKWYHEYLDSFPQSKQAPGLNNQFAELLMEGKDYNNAAKEYENTAYHYKKYAKAADAGYAAVYAYREYLKQAKQSTRNGIKRDIIRSSLKFAEHFPQHKYAAVVLVAAIDDMYALKDYPDAITTGRKIIRNYPHADRKLLRSAWLVVAHASFDIANYKDAELAYIQTIALTSKKDKSRHSLTENLAASVYKQGEQARTLGNHQLAATNFLRVAKVAPTSKIRPTADYDGAAELIHLKQWKKAAVVLTNFRRLFPENKLQHDITQKLAVIYREEGKFILSATEFERIEKENPHNNALRREALNQAALLYEKAKASKKALRVYEKLVDYFPFPIEDVIESRHKIAEIYLAEKQHKKYIYQLKMIVKTDAKGGKNRTLRTKYLAANAALVLAEPVLKAYNRVQLVKPLKKNLLKKKRLMRKAIDVYTSLINYQIADVAAAATYTIAEIYYQFSIALTHSERPQNLNDEELEQYETAIEDKAYPFEEKAIAVHEKNTKLLDQGIYNKWIDKSLHKLAVLMPARYGKTEQHASLLTTIQPPLKVSDLKKTATLSLVKQGLAKAAQVKSSAIIKKQPLKPVADKVVIKKVNGGR